MVGGRSAATKADPLLPTRGPMDMTSSGKQKTTMAKRERENRLRERREQKQAKKDARKLAAQAPDTPPETGANEQVVAGGGPPVPDDMTQHRPDA